MRKDKKRGKIFGTGLLAAAIAATMAVAGVVFVGMKGPLLFAQVTAPEEILDIDCTDSDGGINLFVFGVAKQGEKVWPDFCQKDNYIFEYDCGTSGGVPESKHSGLGGTQYACPDGTICNDGACSSPTCGNGVCEAGEAGEVDPAGCGPNVPNDCLGQPTYKPGSCPKDCKSVPIPPPYVGIEDEVKVGLVGPATFSDVRVGSEASAVQSLVERGIMDVLPDGTFGANLPMTRAELVKSLLLANGALVPEHINSGRFRDVLEGEWYVKFVMRAVALGVVEGYPDGTFRPTNTVNVAELLKITTEALGLPENYPYAYADVSPQDWFSPYAGLAERFELFGRSNTLNPSNLLTRGKVAEALQKVLDIMK